MFEENGGDISATRSTTPIDISNDADEVPTSDDEAIRESICEDGVADYRRVGDLSLFSMSFPPDDLPENEVHTQLKKQGNSSTHYFAASSEQTFCECQFGKLLLR